MNQSEKDNTCRCLSCHETFQRKDAIKTYEDHYGIKLIVKVCPYCGSSNYRAVDPPRYLDKFIGFNDKQEMYWEH